MAKATTASKKQEQDQQAQAPQAQESQVGAAGNEAEGNAFAASQMEGSEQEAGVLDAAAEGGMDWVMDQIGSVEDLVEALAGLTEQAARRVLEAAPQQLILDFLNEHSGAEWAALALTLLPLAAAVGAVERLTAEQIADLITRARKVTDIRTLCELFFAMQTKLVIGTLFLMTGGAMYALLLELLDIGQDLLWPHLDAHWPVGQGFRINPSVATENFPCKLDCEADWDIHVTNEGKGILSLSRKLTSTAESNKEIGDEEAKLAVGTSIEHVFGFDMTRDDTFASMLLAMSTAVVPGFDVLAKALDPILPGLNPYDYLTKMEVSGSISGGLAVTRSLFGDKLQGTLELLAERSYEITCKPIRELDEHGIEQLTGGSIAFGISGEDNAELEAELMKNDIDLDLSAGLGGTVTITADNNGIVGEFVATCAGLEQEIGVGIDTNGEESMSFGGKVPGSEFKETSETKLLEWLNPDAKFETKLTSKIKWTAEMDHEGVQELKQAAGEDFDSLQELVTKGQLNNLPDQAITLIADSIADTFQAELDAEVVAILEGTDGLLKLGIELGCTYTTELTESLDELNSPAELLVMPSGISEHLFKG